MNTDVFVKFYATDCEECLKFAPVWEQLAKHSFVVGNLIIAEINVQHNEILGLRSGQKLPAVTLFPVGK